LRFSDGFLLGNWQKAAASTFIAVEVRSQMALQGVLYLTEMAPRHAKVTLDLGSEIRGTLQFRQLVLHLGDNGFIAAKPTHKLTAVAAPSQLEIRATAAPLGRDKPLARKGLLVLGP
jgi:hypothetical protein